MSTSTSTPIDGSPTSDQAPPGFFAVPVPTLLCGANLPFRLFTCIGGQHVLYCEKNRVFDADKKSTLEEQDIHRLYVVVDERDAYYAYIEENILRLLNGDDVREQEGISRFYATAKVATQKILGAPESAESTRAAHQVVDASIHRVLAHDSLLTYLNQIMEPYPDLYAHSLHVCLYGLALARAAGVTAREELSDLGIGLILHDVGKLKLPLSALEHAGDLTPAEWQMVKQHPTLGVQAVAQNPEVGAIARAVILDHHERLDGSGYPSGKRGEEISIHAQIAAIANAFDRRTTDTIYRPADTSVQVLRRMVVGSKNQYDPKLLAYFVRIMAS